VKTYVLDLGTPNNFVFRALDDSEAQAHADSMQEDCDAKLRVRAATFLEDAAWTAQSQGQEDRDKVVLMLPRLDPH
jgi:hypothetical protein